MEWLLKYTIYLLQDYNRVVLEKIDGVADSDYINASRVDVRTLNEAQFITELMKLTSFRVYWNQMLIL